MRIVYVGTHYNERDIALRDVHPDEIVLLVDMDRCIACGACRLACQAEHGDPPHRPESTKRQAQYAAGSTHVM